MRIRKIVGCSTRLFFLFSALIAFIVFIFLSGCIEWGGKNITIIPKPKPKIENITNITNITNVTNVTESKFVNCEDLDGEEKIECIIERAYKYNNIYDCLKLNDSYLKRCINNLAKIDLAACSYLNQTDDIDNCYLNATSQGEFVCERITNSTKKDACFLSFVDDECKNLTEIFSRYLCDAIKKDNESRCEKSDNYNLCLIRFSKDKRNVCSKITNEALREGCMAIVEKSDKRCSYLSGVVKDYCYQIYASELGLCNVCDKINVSVPYGDNCYRECAISSGSYYFCSKLSSEYERDNCYYNFALKKINVLACGGIMLKMLKRTCYENVAINALDPTICDNLETPYINNCYYKIITLPQITADKCTKMKPSYARDQCFFNIVRNTKESLYCDNIDDTALKNYCKEMFT